MVRAVVILIPDDWSSAQAVMLADRLHVSEVPQSCDVQVAEILEHALDVSWQNGEAVNGA